MQANEAVVTGWLFLRYLVIGGMSQHYPHIILTGFSVILLESCFSTNMVSKKSMQSFWTVGCNVWKIIFITTTFCEVFTLLIICHISWFNICCIWDNLSGEIWSSKTMSGEIWSSKTMVLRLAEDSGSKSSHYHKLAHYFKLHWMYLVFADGWN